MGKKDLLGIIKLFTWEINIKYRQIWPESNGGWQNLGISLFDR